MLLRGAGEPDWLPANEPRLGRAVAMAHGLDGTPTRQQLEGISERWRSYRGPG